MTFPSQSRRRTAPPRWLLPVARFGVAIVGATAFVLSYGALHELALGARIDPHLAWLWPISVDVLAIVSAIAARVFHGGRVSALYAWVVLLAFLGLSVWGNGLHAVADRTADETLTLDPWQAVVVSATPPVALALALHLMLMMGARFAPAGAPPETISAPTAAPGPRHGAKSAPINAPVGPDDRAEAGFGAVGTVDGALIHSDRANFGANFRADGGDQRAETRHAETISALPLAPTYGPDQPAEIDTTADLLARPGANGDAPDDDGDAPSPPYPTKKAHLEALLEALDPGDARTNYELARELAPQIRLHEGTARTYVAAWREKRANQNDQRAVTRTDGASNAPTDRAERNGQAG